MLNNAGPEISSLAKEIARDAHVLMNLQAYIDYECALPGEVARFKKFEGQPEKRRELMVPLFGQQCCPGFATGTCDGLCGLQRRRGPSCVCGGPYPARRDNFATAKTHEPEILRSPPR